MSEVKVSELLTKALEAVEKATDLRPLDAIRVEYLGKQGHLTTLLKSLGSLPADQRPQFGQIVNSAKETLHAAIEDRRKLLEEREVAKALDRDSIDVTLPGRGMDRGHQHIISDSIQKISQWFLRLGFELAEGPEIEEDYYNFEALNIPAHHPARAMHDTFYFPDGKLLRTHTSPVQIRAMMNQAPPFNIVSIGKVYRIDFDISHTPMFHQVEGFMVGKGIHFGHLKGVLQAFLQAYFEQEFDLRFRPSYFPFTEPSAEVDIQCVKCGGKGCRTCSHTGWLEILGCGMVHPKVLQNCKVDPELYTGFAFGMGVERITMLKYGISDIRLLFENDLRFLEQF